MSDEYNKRVANGVACLTAAAPVLAKHGADGAVVQWAGSGDTGDVNEISLTVGDCLAKEDIAGEILNTMVSVRIQPAHVAGAASKTSELSVREALRESCQWMLSACPGCFGLEINAGGTAELNVQVGKKKIKWEFDANHNSETECNHLLEIDSVPMSVEPTPREYGLADGARKACKSLMESHTKQCVLLGVTPGSILLNWSGAGDSGAVESISVISADKKRQHTEESRLLPLAQSCMEDILSEQPECQGLEINDGGDIGIFIDCQKEKLSMDATSNEDLDNATPAGSISGECKVPQRMKKIRSGSPSPY